MSEPENNEAATDAKPEAAADAKPEAAADAEVEKSGASGADAPLKKKKKKKKRNVDAPKEELDAEGRERPTFVLTFPCDPALDHAVKAFELGDYQSVRTEAGKLAEHPNPDVRAAAGELLRRIEPDPLVKVLLAMSVLLLVVVTVWAYRTHGP